MPLRLRDEYLESSEDNRVRPYTVGISRHKETLSSILVYTNNQSEEEADKVQNFFSSYNEGAKPIIETIQNLTIRAGKVNPGDIRTGDPANENSGEIALLSLDGQQRYYGVFNNFSLLSVSESSEQIIKLHVNFGKSWNAFFFGEQPSIFTYEGFFLDSEDYPYYQEFMIAYHKYLSGRKAIENKVETKFVYDGKIVDGYLMGIRVQQSAGDALIKRFQFTVLVKGTTWIRENLVPVSKTIGEKEVLQLNREANGMSNIHRLRQRQITGVLKQDTDFQNN